METLYVVLGVVGLLALGGGSLALGQWTERRRTRRFGAFAAERGWTYAERDDRWARLDAGYPHGEGRRHLAGHVMRGEVSGRRLTVYEHRWTTGRGDGQRHRFAGTVLLGLPATLGRVTVLREDAGRRMARGLGAGDVELESEEFNRAYRVAGDRRLASDVLHPRLMEWMLRTDAPGFTINGRFIAAVDDGPLDLDLVDGRVAALDAIVDQLPPHLLR